MKQRNIVFFVLTVVFLFVHTVALAAGKHALLVGIGDYGEKAPFLSLQGPANDLSIVEGVLRERFGFQDEDFIILLNAQATHSGIEQALR